MQVFCNFFYRKALLNSLQYHFLLNAKRCVQIEGLIHSSAEIESVSDTRLRDDEALHVVASGWTYDEKPNLSDAVGTHHQRRELLVDVELAPPDDDGIIYRANMRRVVSDVYCPTNERIVVSD